MRKSCASFNHKKSQFRQLATNIMKKIILTIIGLALIIPYSFAYYEYTENVKILSLDQRTRNVIVERDGEKWLLHYNGTCDQMEEGGNLILSIRGDLDASGDLLKTGSYYKCDIDQAEVISGKLDVNYTFNNKTQANVQDEDGVLYTITVGSDCHSIAAYTQKQVYYKKYGSSLSVGDLIYIPRDEARCPLLYVKKEEWEPEPEEAEEDEDVMAPAMVGDVTPIPADGKVYLEWDEATDNVGISHYIISYSTNSLRTETYDVKDMPNQIISEDINYEITDLENETTYYFYVLAVDTNGNEGSTWSTGVSTTPMSSIRDVEKTHERTAVRIFKTQATSYSFLFRWGRIASFDRQTVILEVDGERDFSFLEWDKDYIRILKKDHRKGKPLKLIVRQYDIRGQMFVGEYEFEF